jgi:hypothetical protein
MINDLVKCKDASANLEHKLCVRKGHFPLKYLITKPHIAIISSPANHGHPFFGLKCKS